MPLVRLVKEEVKTYPREFALLTQLSGAYKLQDVYDVKAEELAKIKDKGYIDEEKANNLSNAADELLFADFATALWKNSAPVEGEGNAMAWAAQNDSGVMAPWKFNRREVGDYDVAIQITYAGICHSDLHQILNEWKQAEYPMVPGHEIVGIVTAVGPSVTKFAVGDRAAIGTHVNSCGSCRHCNRGREQACTTCVWTYNTVDRDGTVSKGGFSTYIVAVERHVLRLPDGLSMERAAPLLCAGVTVYSPIVHFGLNKPGTRLGVNGLGGLGHMVVKFGVAMGCEVTVISRNRDKEELARAMGATHYLVSSDAEAMKAAAFSLDGIVDTVSAKHSLEDLVNVLDHEGRLVIVGLPADALIFPLGPTLSRRAVITGNGVGGIQETQEMLEFCVQHNVLPDVEIISADYINEAFKRLAKADVKFRFVIDVQGTLLMDKEAPARPKPEEPKEEDSSSSSDEE